MGALWERNPRSLSDEWMPTNDNESPMPDLHTFEPKRVGDMLSLLRQNAIHPIPVCNNGSELNTDAGDVKPYFNMGSRRGLWPRDILPWKCISQAGLIPDSLANVIDMLYVGTNHSALV